MEAESSPGVWRSFERRSRSWPVAIAAFLVISCFLALWRLGATDVVAMEGIVADGARTMMATGEYSVPRLHGEIYTYKPPLAYWLALAPSLFTDAVSEWTLRLPFALLGVLMGFVVFWAVGRRLNPAVGLVCGLASITGNLVLEKLRLAEFDIPLTAFVGIATVVAILELTSRRRRSWRWQVVYIALGLAFLAKGIPALMFFAPGLLVACWWMGGWRRLLSPAHLAGALTFGLVVGSWVFAAWAAEGAAAFAQPLAEANAKGLTWNLRAVGSTLLKPAVLVAAFLPWSLALPFALLPGSWKHLGDEERTLARAAGGFVAAGLAAFMLVPSTETRYLMPLAAPVAVLAGVLWTSRRLPGLRVAVLGLAVAVTVAMVLGAPTLVVLGELDVPWSETVPIVAAGTLLGAALWSRRRLPKGAARPAAWCTALALCLWTFHVYVIAPHRAESRSLRKIAEQFEPHLQDGEEVWTRAVRAGFHHSSLTFYLDRRVKTYSEGHRPPPGSEILHFSDEHPDPAGPEVCVLETGRKRHYRFSLLRVAGSPEDGDCGESVG